MQRKHICKKCHKYFENPFSKSGRSLHICPECRYKKKPLNPAEFKLKIHEIYLKNKEYYKKYYLNNRNKILLQNKQKYLKNKEKC